MPTHFKTLDGQKMPLPVFFPDATQAVIKTLDTQDIKNTATPGILVNTYHLQHELGKSIFKKFNGVRPFMNWSGAVISDSGGFQVMSIAKQKGSGGRITDKGVTFKSGGKKEALTPESSIEFQLALKPDMCVVLDDFTPPNCSHEEAEDTVKRTILWAKRSKDHFEKLTQRMKNKPYLLAVVQGGDYLDLRAECALKLAQIGFDGFGYGGWPITQEGHFNYEVAKAIADHAPQNYFLYGLGVGKPDEIVGCVRLGYHIFDCVLPTRDARHKRLYILNAASINQVDLTDNKFFSYYVPDKESAYKDNSPVSTACDCQLCQNYSRAYLAHLFRINEMTAMRLATIHNLRFYSLLMERLQLTLA